MEGYFAIFSRYILARLSRYAPFFVFVGGCGAIVAVVDHAGVPWMRLLFGASGVNPKKLILVIALAVLAGLALGILDEYVTLKLYSRCAARLRSEGKDWSENFPFLSSDVVALLVLLAWTFGEEGIRAGLLFGLDDLLRLTPLVTAFIVGILMGISHGIYGMYAVPTKIVDSVVLGLVLLQFGLVVSFILHLTLNFYMLFLEIRRAK